MKSKNKNMLILTGPQGSGNHLWSKIFSLHPEVFGWKSLLENYWEAHRFAEPFCEYWKNPELLSEFDWSNYEYYFTSISVPLGIKDKKWEPNILKFKECVEKQGINVQIAVIGRDQNILRNQQQRLREEDTLKYFMNQLIHFDNHVFLSYELLYLYKEQYLKSLNFNIPISWNDNRIGEILKNDANLKYIHYVDSNPLDNCNKTGIPIKELPTN